MYTYLPLSIESEDQGEEIALPLGRDFGVEEWSIGLLSALQKPEVGTAPSGILLVLQIAMVGEGLSSLTDLRRALWSFPTESTTLADDRGGRSRDLGIEASRASKSC